MERSSEQFKRMASYRQRTHTHTGGREGWQIRAKNSIKIFVRFGAINRQNLNDSLPFLHRPLHGLQSAIHVDGAQTHGNGTQKEQTAQFDAGNWRRLEFRVC